MYIIELIINSILQSGPLALATFAIVLIFRTSFTTNFAQGMIGTVAAFITTYILMPSPDITGNVPSPTFLTYLIAISVGIIVSFIISMLVDIVIFRNSKYITPVGKQIVTMGIVLIITGLIPFFFGISDRSLPRIGANLEGTFIDTILLSGVEGLRDIGIFVKYHMVLGFLISFIIIGTLFIMLKYTRWGLGVRATASNENVASMMGINTRFITAMSWAIAGGLGALAAILISSNKGTFGNVTVYFMVAIQVQAFFAAILGGFSTFHGPIIGIILLTFFKNLFTSYLNPWGNTVLYLFVLLIVLIKPLGLFGKKIAKKV
ncbi:branched-chain amino acid ABC transporter permease [Mycoplasmatota bacterium]|nr:branched-chain amino acid ABC transporter permease [Mycoplasmatota bacterium]